MSNGKSKKSQKSKKRASGRARTKTAQGRMQLRQMRGNMQLHELAMGVCSVSNPFCPEAVGARWPDNSYTKSLPYDFVAFTGLNTNASGAACSLFTAPLNNQVSTATIVGTTATFTSFDKPGGTNTQTAIGRYRLTSFGVKLWCTQSKMVATGTVTIALLSPFNFSSLGTVDIFTLNADRYIHLPVSRLIEQDFFVRSNPLGDDARLFREPVPNGNMNIENIGWQAIMVSVSGGGTSVSGAIHAELYYHYELIPDDSNVASLYATAPPANNPVIQAGTADVLSKVDNFFDGAGRALDRIFNNRATKYLAAGVSTYFGGPAAGAATLQLTNGGPRAIMVD